MLAPLAKTACGTATCGEPVFKTTNDPDFQSILKTFDSIHQLMKDRPRMEMPGAQAAACCETGYHVECGNTDLAAPA